MTLELISYTYSGVAPYIYDIYYDIYVYNIHIFYIYSTYIYIHIYMYVIEHIIVEIAVAEL